ncbi:SLC13 family permease [Methanoplanus endosymbiosus]|uniref:SLC13 family permease n=1 Tax=Methanoplanus endosymbiosus TaxID=33865 RepID=A0A9E7PTE0_9EURY|nr:SLC13 family permease [Methanoplanus endosymbiosus]UUX93562.1 SLC13 family permease [Methanoplanus endosymbiosus]
MDVQIILTLFVLILTVFLFVTEILRSDVSALIILTTLVILGLVTPQEAFEGFSSEAVIAMVGVMVISSGIQRTGLMIKASRYILDVAGRNEKRLVGVVSIFEGLISAFLQNVGSAALFIPALMRISRLTGIPSRRILLPIGYAAVIGGTVTMIGSATLILVNDFLLSAGYEPYGLFDVTPVGIALVITGVFYFFFFGRYVLPDSDSLEGDMEQEGIVESWNLVSSIYYVRVVGTSRLKGVTRKEAELLKNYNLYLIALLQNNDVLYAPWTHTRFTDGQILALMGVKEDVSRFCSDFGVTIVPGGKLADSMSNDLVGFAEAIIRPKSHLIGKSIFELNFRKSYGLEPLILFSGQNEENAEFSDRPLNAGDTIVVQGLWDNIRKISSDHDFYVTTHIEGDTYRRTKEMSALACFLSSIFLTFTGLSIAVSFLIGAIGMVLLGVLSSHEAYRSVEWEVIVLIGGIFPLSVALSESGFASWISGFIGAHLAGNLLLFLVATGIVMTVSTIILSNIASTVVFVPIFIQMSSDLGIHPAPVALLAGICASNSFILPTHQVNALIKSPGNYKNSDFIRAGLGMTVLFLVVSVSLIYLFYY